MSIEAFAETLNAWGYNREPYLFLVDFEMQKPVALRLNEVDPQQILFDIRGFTNAEKVSHKAVSVTRLRKYPLSIEAYKNKFDIVHRHLCYGNSYLTNLTVSTRVETEVSLKDMFYLSRAKYKLLYKNEFLVFSPEIFVQIRDGKIFSYPMKGTIDAALPDAHERILNDSKECAEHVTIVDLIRNDLSQVARNVTVTRFRYIDELKTTEKALLQVSSEITGELPDDYRGRIGDILIKLLPAGSVSGAPKARTVEIIRQAEAEKRGYYTGVFGYFDGEQFDSGVMIRFIERQGENYYYRSGGGITTQSVLETEYREVIDKVYVPVD